MNEMPLQAFGVQVAGIGLLLRSGEALEYLPEARIHPLPLAGPGVAGLVQVHGQALVTVTAEPIHQRHPWRVIQRPVLVVCAGAQPGAESDTRSAVPTQRKTSVHSGALCIDSPPRALQGLTALVDYPRPACLFADCLLAPMASGLAHEPDGQDPQRRPWWQVDLSCLFKTLAGV
jgi:hypothetical protein